MNNSMPANPDRTVRRSWLCRLGRHKLTRIPKPLVRAFEQTAQRLPAIMPDHQRWPGGYIGRRVAPWCVRCGWTADPQLPNVGLRVTVLNARRDQDLCVTCVTPHPPGQPHNTPLS